MFYPDSLVSAGCLQGHLVLTPNLPKRFFFPPFIKDMQYSHSNSMQQQNTFKVILLLEK